MQLEATTFGFIGTDRCPRVSVRRH